MLGAAVLLAIASGCLEREPAPEEAGARSGIPDARSESAPALRQRGAQASPAHEAWAQRPKGRWRPTRTHRAGTAQSDEQRRMIEELETIGYASGSVMSDGSGVTRHDPGRASKGLNLFTSGHAPEAILMDMDARVLHRWRKEFRSVWPDHPDPERWPGSAWWRRAYLYPNGDLLAIFEGLGIIKIDKDSKLLWASASKAHHDLEVMPNGDVWVLAREARVIPRLHAVRPILEDYIVVLGADGQEKRRISILEALEQSEYRTLWDESGVDPGSVYVGDIFHTNTLSMIGSWPVDRPPAFRAGNVLVSFLTFDVIAVVDPDLGRVVWASAGDFRSQHDPKLLPTGRLLLFDNLGDAGRSRVIELNLVSGETVWSYRGSTEEPLFTRTCGAAERLENGNTLVTESDAGRAVEVTPEGEIVWEFYNPHRAGKDGALIATLFEMVRLPADFPTDWLE